jgi:hypothetical protein
MRPLIVGAATWLPGVPQLLARAKTLTGLGGAGSARYCYSVWLRHVALLAEHGLWGRPERVAELGPGDSLGLGLCALLCGAQRYQALDVVPFAAMATNLAILPELVALFRQRAPIPDDVEFPEVTPRLRDYRFPAGALPAQLLAGALADERVAAIRAALEGTGSAAVTIRYEPDWVRRPPQGAERVDLILSQAVLEHVDDLSATYAAMAAWLAPGGVMSHAIDFRCHNMFRQWNGHWTVPDSVWAIMRGRRVYLINRQPYSVHLAELARAGCTDVRSVEYRLPVGISRGQLAARFRPLTDVDLETGMATIQARASLPVVS